MPIDELTMKDDLHKKWFTDRMKLITRVIRIVAFSAIAIAFVAGFCGWWK
jgi:hypothetical protein